MKKYLIFTFLSLFAIACSDEPTGSDKDLYNDLINGKKNLFMHAWFGSVYSQSDGSSKWINTDQLHEDEYEKNPTSFTLPKNNNATAIVCETYITIARGKIWFEVYHDGKMCGNDKNFAIVYKAWSQYCDETNDYTRAFYLTADLEKNKTFNLAGKTYTIENFSNGVFDFSTTADNVFLKDMGIDINNLDASKYKFVWKYRNTHAPIDFINDKTIGYSSLTSFLTNQIDKMAKHRESYTVDGVDYTIAQLRDIVENNASKWEPTDIRSLCKQFSPTCNWF